MLYLSGKAALIHKILRNVVSVKSFAFDYTTILYHLMSGPVDLKMLIELQRPLL